MAMHKTEIKAIAKRAQRIARREVDRIERRKRSESEDPDLNRRALLKRRSIWKKKFNIFALCAAGGWLASVVSNPVA
jgi:hypothetical protein